MNDVVPTEPTPPVQAAPLAVRMVRRAWLIIDGIALLFWTYALTKLFFVDLDVHVVQSFFPNFAWLLSFKFIFFLGFAALLFLLMGRGWAIATLAYILFYPIVLIFWRIPALILRRRSWTSAFIIVNSLFSFFQSIRYRVIVSLCWLLALLVAFMSRNQFMLWAACLALIGLLLTAYIRKLLFIVKSSALFETYRTVFSELRLRSKESYTLDAEMRALTFDEYDKHQVEQYKTKLWSAVLFNRACLFSARRLKDYHRSGVHVLSAVLTGLSLVVLSTFTFAVVHLALYKIDQSWFETSSAPTFFTFLYYSFNTFVANSVKDLVPTSPISQAAAMLQTFFGLFLLGIFISLALPFRSDRYAAELNETISALQAEGHEMEEFIRNEYRVETIEDALSELEKLKASFVRMLVVMSEGLK